MQDPLAEEFKAIIKQLGHAVGEEALKAVVKEQVAALRATAKQVVESTTPHLDRVGEHLKRLEALVKQFQPEVDRLQKAARATEAAARTATHLDETVADISRQSQQLQADLNGVRLQTTAGFEQLRAQIQGQQWAAAEAAQKVTDAEGRLASRLEKAEREVVRLLSNDLAALHERHGREMATLHQRLGAQGWVLGFFGGLSLLLIIVHMAKALG